MKRWPAIAAVVVLIGLLAFGIEWRASYAPLSIDAQVAELGSTLTHSRPLFAGSTGRGDGFTDLEPKPGDDDPRRHVATSYIDGQHLVYAVALHNNGRVGVTITGFELPGHHDNALLAVTRVRPAPPFSLGGGDTREIVVSARMHACEFFSPGSSNTFSELPLSYRTLGLTRHTSLPTPMRIEITRTDETVCPRPQL